MPRPFRKTYVGKKKNYKKNYRQKSAYRPKQKKKFMRKRQPFVETKKAKDVIFTDEVMNPLVLEVQPNAQYRTWRHTQISPIDKFMFLNRGVGNQEIIGRDIFSKYLKQKIEITLPAGIIPDTTIPNGNTNRPFCRITQPIQIWVVWGWIKKPFGHRIDRNNPNLPVDLEDVYNEVDLITDNGDALLGNMATRGTLDSDFLTFKDKRKNMWTQQKRLLRPRDTPTSVIPPDSFQAAKTITSETASQIPSNLISDFGDFQTHGYPNVLQTTISWDTQRKMRYEANDDSAEGGGFAKDSWIPYAYICIPKQFQDAVNRASPALYRYPVDMNETATHNFYDLVGDMKISTNMCHWFTDS